MLYAKTGLVRKTALQSSEKAAAPHYRVIASLWDRMIFYGFQSPQAVDKAAYFLRSNMCDRIDLSHFKNNNQWQTNLHSNRMQHHGKKDRWPGISKSKQLKCL